MLLGCAREIDIAPPQTGVTFAVFDPSASPPKVPSPTDLAVDRSTGLLNVPVADAATRPAQAYFDAFLNTLDGYPPTATAEVRFTGELDATSICSDGKTTCTIDKNPKSVMVFEIDPKNPAAAAPVTKGLTLEYVTVSGSDGTSSMLRIWNYAGWKSDMRYAFFVTTGVKDKAGKPIASEALFELAAGDEPLCAWEADKSWDSTTGTCSTPASGATASGCCSFNYNALIDSSVKKAVRAAEENKDLEGAELETKAQAAVLASATDFEMMRRAFEGLFAIAKAAGVDKKDVAVMWSFKTVGINQAVFNPSAVPPAVPTPTDLIRDPKTGLLGIPDNPTASPAEQEFNDYLRTLTGYPTATGGSLSFTAEIDDTAVADGIAIYEIDMTGASPKVAKVKADDYTVAYDKTTSTLSISPKVGWTRARTLAVVALGGDSALKNKTPGLTKYPKRMALMHLALSPHPLCESYDKSTASCGGAPLVSSFIDDPEDKPGALTGKQKAALFETMRQSFHGVLELITAADSSLKSDDIAALWPFTTATQAEVIFDPTAGVIPFPNDFLLDSTTGKVNIPATPGETAEEKALREALNTLDGFTTTGTYFAPYAGKIDPTSADKAILAINAKTLQPISMEFKVDEKASVIKCTPKVPLPEKAQFIIVMTSKIKAKGELAADTGLQDDKGNYVVGSSANALLRSSQPLVDANGKSTISTVDDDTAKQLEAGRQQYAMLFTGLKALQIEREDVVAFWAFTTQSITEVQTKLRAMPWQILAVADSNAPKLIGKLDTTLASFPAAPNESKSDIGGFAQGVFVSWWAIDPTTGAFLPDPTKGKGVQIPFLLTLPKGAKPATGWPLVVFQHGIGRGKLQALYTDSAKCGASCTSVANALAKAGYATIAFDIPFHGDRSLCVEDAECDGGTCDTATGKCSTKFKLDDTGVPEASGNDAFLPLNNPFAIRDHLRQYTIDAAALLRAIALGGASGITTTAGAPAGVSFDLTKVHFAGISLGAMLGNVIMAVDSLPQRAFFGVPGATAANIYLSEDSAPAWAEIKKKVLAAMNVEEGTADYVQLLTTFNWIVDPADPANFAPYLAGDVQLPDLLCASTPKPAHCALTGDKVTKKTVMYLLAENDTTIPKIFGQYLADAAGFETTTDKYTTVYTGQGHHVFLEPSPDKLATQAAQAQLVNFIKTGGVCKPNLTAGTCQ
jgi:dienelactone hydrolase